MSQKTSGRHKTMPAMVSRMPIQGSSSKSHNPKSSPATPNINHSSDSIDRKSPLTGQTTREGSPQSQHSDASQTPLLGRRRAGGCKFETGMAQAKRRVPYSMGPEKLSAEPEEKEKTLNEQQSEALTSEITSLYARLLPSSESETRRSQFVQKLDQLLRVRWPDAQIRVSVFGSTGNLLGTSDSDVDICITTDCKEVENVCLIAELLAQSGMQRIVCVSSAKVPIVKAWDPELQVACDMNVNNPIALENTQMIRSYIQIDERVRPLAMVIKHWAKRRILNDAALGGTLSSYTWICMLLNFLQTRTPPILPALQQKEGLPSVNLGGVNVAFDKDFASYNGFGSSNTTPLGNLLFEFFKYYGHELDFEENAISLRLGKVIPKSQKAWHLLQDNRLCVEEPFNTSRNLANTADDTSMRGIHLELRRAFTLLSEGDLARCCEEYIRAPEEYKQTATFIHQTARPIIPQAPTSSTASNSRGNRNGNRSSRNSNRNSARRGSNPANRNPNYLHDLPFQMTPQELQLQAQHQQHLLHDQLFQQYQYLQLQEQELRMQLYQQSLRQRGLIPSQNYSGSSPAGESSIRLPISPSLYQNRFGNTSPFLASPSPSNGIMTNPASPLLGHAVPDSRRFTRRTSVATSAPAASVRTQSQPARSITGSSVLSHGPSGHYELASDAGDFSDRRSSLASHVSAANMAYLSHPHPARSSTLYEAGRRPAEFMGFYVGVSPSLVAHPQSTAISPIPSHAGLAIQNGGLSPQLPANESHLTNDTTSPSLPRTSLGNAQNASNGIGPARFSPSPPFTDGPLVIDGSLRSPKRRQQANRNPISNSDNYTISTTTSEDPGIDTPASSEDQYQDSGDNKISIANGLHNSQNCDGALTPFQSLSLQSEALHNGLAVKHKLTSPDIHRSNALSSQDLTPTSAASFTIDMVTANGTSTQPGQPGRKQIKADRESPGEVAELPPFPLRNKTNGIEATSSQAPTPQWTDATGGWHTQKRKRKGEKTVKSEGDAEAFNSAGGELLPLDKSLRKGG